MKKIIVIQDAHVGVYGMDTRGNHWASFAFAGSGGVVPCTRCGAAISSGYECGLYPESLPYCSSHIQWVYPQEDTYPQGETPQHRESIGGRYSNSSGSTYYFCAVCERMSKGDYGRLYLERTLYTTDTWANRECYHCRQHLFSVAQEERER